MDFYKGSLSVLYIMIDSIYLPIGCLNENSFSEDVEMIDTTTRENNGWATSRPTRQSFSVEFSGIQINTLYGGGDFNKVSYDKLKTFKRSRTLIDWKIATEDNQFVEKFKGYIVGLSEQASSDNFLTFEGSIQGYGEPESSTEKILGLLVNDNEGLEDGNNNIIIS